MINNKFNVVSYFFIKTKFDMYQCAKHLFIGFLVFFCLCFSLKAQVDGSIIINRGSSFTNSRLVNLVIISRGAKEMLISNNGSFIGRQWEPYKQVRNNWKLTQSDGIKTVYIKFRGASGEISEISSAQIGLDTEPPENIDFNINGGKPYTNNKNRLVLLRFEGENIYKMRVSQNNIFHNSAWTTFSEARKWRLSGAEGTKSVYVQYMDRAGNKSPILEDKIILDYTPPSKCKVSINRDVKYTNKRTVNLFLQADQATQMIVKGWDEWMPYKSQISYDLPGSEGLKRIYVKFRDDAGNTSNIVHDDIIFDMTPPTNIVVEINNGSSYINDYRKSQVYILCQGANFMMVSNYSDFRNSYWEKYKPLLPEWSLIEGEGERNIYVKLKDFAGNESEIYSDKIIIDPNPPENASVRIIAPNSIYDEETQITYINQEVEHVNLEIKGDAATYALISNDQNFFGASWQAYTPIVKDWKLQKDENGLRRVFVKLRDEAGNQTKIFFDQVVIDIDPPLDCKISIDNHAEYCTNKELNVTLSLFARGAKYMKISNEPNFENSEWLPYTHTIKWKLEGNDGLKSVFVKYKDIAENKSEPIQDDIILDTKPPYDTKITINKGEKTTNHYDRTVLMKLRAKDAIVMRVSNEPNFKTSRWMAYSELNFKWQLPNEDGDHHVYAQFRDEAGNISPTINSKITLDRSPPIYPSVVINDGEVTTNNKNKDVILTLKAFQAVEMRISNIYDLRHSSNWIPFQENYKWKLVGGDGLKTVYAQFKDSIGNFSRIVFDRIGIDRRAPTSGKISINHKAQFTTNVNGVVNLDIYVRGATEMMISNDITFKNAKWQPYQHFLYNWYLDGDDGKKTVYIRFRDDSGNETEPTSASIILDRQEPINTKIAINKGAKYITNPNRIVNLDIVAEGATEMLITNSSYLKSKRWEAYKPTKSWVLLDKEGKKTVYAQFRDEAGNTSDITESSIILDTEPPKGLHVIINDGKKVTYHTSVNLSILAENADYMRIGRDSNFSGVEWEPYREIKEWELLERDGLQRVYVSFKDKAENVSTFIFGQITYSSTK